MNKIGVSQKAVIINKEGKILALRRTSTALSNPDKWDLPGGDLDFGEDVLCGIIREIKEETGLEIKKLKLFNVESHIDKKGEFWVTIAYKAKTKNNNLKLSSEHNDFKWVTKKEFLNLETPEKIKHFVENFNIE